MDSILVHEMLELHQQEIHLGHSNHHKLAPFLATVAICAGKQNSFWTMHDRMIDNVPSSPLKAIEIAKSLGLNEELFNACLADLSNQNQINNDLQQAKDMGVLGTPSFIVCIVQPNGRIMAKKMIQGVPPLEVFERTISDVSVQ